MPITINGTGTIAGLSAGGLPDASITTADIADANITAAKLNGAQSGSAPIYGARAWVNFNGTGTVAIRASGNVSSITDNGAGLYTLNFTAAMPDTNYATIGTAREVNGSTEGAFGLEASGTQTTTAVQVATYDGSFVLIDSTEVNVVVFR